MTEYKTVNSLTDKFLIGQQIWIRSPITCCAHDGVCKECYGDLYYTNNDLNSAGAYSATIIMNPVMQGLLSAKHHQSTSSNMITFQEEFDDFFTISATDIILNNTIDDVESYSLVIMRDDFCSSEDGDDDDSDSLSQVSSTRGRHSKKNSQQYDDGDSEDDSMNLVLSYYTTRFFVVKNLHNKKKQEWIEFYDKDKKELFMHDDFVNSLVYRKDDDGKEYFFINLEDLDLEKFIFMVDVENNELTKPMKAIEKLINNKNHEGCSTYEEMCQKMLDLIIQSGLESTSVHGEMIIRNLIREKGGNGLNRPDFSRLIMSQDYEILTVKTALKRNPSITTSLSTPYLKYQLINMNETFDKTDLSDLDPLFRKTLTVEETIE